MKLLTKLLSLKYTKPALAVVVFLSLALGILQYNRHLQMIQISQGELEELSDQMKNTIIQALQKEKNLSKINDLKVSAMKQNVDGKVEITYILSFDNGSQDTGDVTHVFDATAVLEKNSGEWKLSQVVPRSQSLAFHQPLEVVSQTRPVKKSPQSKSKAK